MPGFGRVMCGKHSPCLGTGEDPRLCRCDSGHRKENVIGEAARTEADLFTLHICLFTNISGSVLSINTKANQIKFSGQ